jgi:hypothetical protein
LKLLLLYCVFLTPLIIEPVKGQVLNTGNKQDTPNEMILKVSQFGQFIKRFNFEEDFKGNEITSSFSEKISRSDYIDLLFDKYDARLISSNTAYSADYAQQKDEFIKFVTDKNLKIQRISDSLYSIAVCEISYHGKLTTLQLILKQQLINNGIGWVICDADADFFYDKNHCSGSTLYIPPTSNDVNYIHLKNYFENKDSLACYAYQGYTCNRLSIFFHLLYSGEIQYKHVNSVIYFIGDIPGWIIQVREYNREDDNSGWLIADIVRNNTTISNYMKQLVDQTR